MKIPTFAFVYIFILLFPVPGLTDEVEEVDLLAKEKIGAMIEILQDKSLDKATRNARVITLLGPLFDFPRMAQLSLGQKHWKATQPGKTGGIFRSFYQTDPKFLPGEVGLL